MPVYEFHCKECRGDFKTLRAADKIAEVTCPSCGTLRVSRLLSVTAQSRPTEEPCGLGMGGACGMNPSACACRNA